MFALTALVAPPRRSRATGLETLERVTAVIGRHPKAPIEARTVAPSSAAREAGAWLATAVATGTVPGSAPASMPPTELFRAASLALADLALDLPPGARRDELQRCADLLLDRTF